MPWRVTLAGDGVPTWSIALATHLGTEIANETTEPTLVANQLTIRKERQFDKFTRRRGPIAGYNCFGLAFANRRTSLYFLEGIDVEGVLAEDGFGEVKEPDLPCVGDIVIYSDERGPRHVGTIIRIERIAGIVLSTAEAALPSRGEVPIVLSKFGDQTGEYEHPMWETGWDAAGFGPEGVSIRTYRHRQQIPTRSPATGWRKTVSDR